MKPPQRATMSSRQPVGYRVTTASPGNGAGAATVDTAEMGFRDSGFRPQRFIDQIVRLSTVAKVTHAQ